MELKKQAVVGDSVNPTKKALRKWKPNSLEQDISRSRKIWNEGKILSSGRKWWILSQFRM